MEPLQFLEELKKIIGGDIVQENVCADDTKHGRGYSDEYGLPHMMVNRRNLSIKIDFVIKEELQMTVYATPPRCLSVKIWTLFDKILSWCFLLGATGFPGEKENRFFLQGMIAKEAEEYFTPARATLINNLFPFVEVEQQSRVYRLLKWVEIGKNYSPQQAAKDLDTLLDFVEQTKA